MEYIIVTGMSGAGKSRAMAALEDIGYYCIDNVPPMLLAQFSQLFYESNRTTQRVALAVDSRGATQVDEFAQGLLQMQQCGIAYKVMFLECEDEVLVRRYKETRRNHPLTVIGDATVADAIARERRMLGHMKAVAQYMIDTSHLTTAQLKEQIVQMFLDNPDNAMTVQCMSFGYKYGVPLEADLVLDVRCFRNPFYVEELKHKTGLDTAVQDFVCADPAVAGFEQRLYDLVDYMLPLYRNEGKSRLVIAVGCTGGKHRSVTLAQRLFEHMKAENIPVLINHRDIDKV